MAVGHLMDTYCVLRRSTPVVWGGSRRSSASLAHLCGMDTTIASPDAVEPVLTLSQLAAHLSVPVQTLYDLRSQGRGPRGFRVGRELRFRRCEVDAWLTRLETADGERHPARTRR